MMDSQSKYRLWVAVLLGFTLPAYAYAFSYDSWLWKFIIHIVVYLIISAILDGYGKTVKDKNSISEWRYVVVPIEEVNSETFSKHYGNYSNFDEAVIRKYELIKRGQPCVVYELKYNKLG